MRSSIGVSRFIRAAGTQQVGDGFAPNIGELIVKRKLVARPFSRPTSGTPNLSGIIKMPVNEQIVNKVQPTLRNTMLLKSRLGVLFAALLASACGGGGGDGGNGSQSGSASSGSSGGLPAPSGQIAIAPMTNVNVSAHTGYFQDPYPVHLTSPSNIQYFTGTTPAILSCAYPIKAGCFTSAPLSVGAGKLQTQIDAAGATITNFQNMDAYQDSSGAWQMALAIGVNNSDRSFHWTVIVHATPTGPVVAGAVPTQWACDQVLVGSFTTPVDGNYSPKYFEDNNQLYLVYVKRVPDSSPARNAIVAQRMASAIQLAATAPVRLLAPDDTDGGFNSELFDTVKDEAGFKVVEVANVTKINGKFALAYSVGEYDEAGYKSGIAWSDTFLPASGSTYRRVQQLDSTGVWGQVNHQEVRYLLQSQHADWPDFVGSQVVGPGVPSIVQGSDGTYYLYFAGFDPGDLPQAAGEPAGIFDGASRRPYFVRLTNAVPAGETVAAASDADLAGWLVPVTQ